MNISIDESMFASSQADVTLSHLPSWESFNITSFDLSAIKVDEQMLVNIQD
ncbi:3816_t:CDS:2 [Diversispora eburnea]|uniref:3816_t:CDS:1 n=1 Tax=Diversispora eburnea TaxID=1213867 RepID=A0A9N9B031_9GLOM|nr:3816_t:CDS:2 [Diversispora eburnea]